MTLNLSLPGHEELKPRITVFGVGGAGGNAVNNMIEKELDGVEFVVANTDAQALQQSKADQRIQMGLKVTEGLGAGARATVGAAAAEESIEQIVDQLAGAHMCFITAGMGGGTGTGAAPIIAQAARELGVLTVGVVTKPFQFEGGRRMRQAEEGVEALQKVVDTLIIIPNQNLFRLATENTTFTEAFALADDVLYQGVKGVTDLMVRPGLINLDFADVRSVMDEMGKAMMGTGEAEGEDRAKQAAQKAIANPLLDEISLHGAKGVLINITGGYDLTLFELDEAANEIRDKVHEDANIIVGSTLDTAMEGRMRVSVVATGIDAVSREEAAPQPRRALAEPVREPRRDEPRRDEQRREEARREDTRREEPRREAPVARTPEPREEPRREAPTARAPEPEAPRERSLLDDMDDRDHRRAPAARDDSDDLPPPAYQPRQQPDMDASESFTAPRSSRPGEPTPEALARLQAAVQRQPKGAPADSRRPVESEGEKARFGINSLIGRMTGEPKAAAPAPRQQPQVSASRDQAAPARPRADDEVDPDQERIEIPAFLRRQAN